MLAALACGAGAMALVLSSDRDEPRAVWAILGPAVVVTFVGTGLYAWRRRPESRTGALMVLLAFAWSVSAPTFSNDPLPYTVASSSAACGAACSSTS